MTIKPSHHWNFKKGNETQDSITKKVAKFHKINFDQHGQIGYAICTRDKDSFVSFGENSGKFGTKDFTIAFGIKVTNTRKQKALDIIGNRYVTGHGNWLSLILEAGGVLVFEVDENNKATNYAVVKTGKVLTPHKWHHIAISREGSKLCIYLNGSLVRSGKAKSGKPANISNAKALRIGHTKRHVAKANFEDLRIYNTALSEKEIQALLPPIDGLLKTGQVELSASDGARHVFTGDNKDLFQLSNRFEKLRLGPDTGATIYKEATFSGASQKLHAGIPEILRSKIQSFPRSLHIWRSTGEPFQGQWVIRAANGHFLSWDRARLKTSTKCSTQELFQFNFNQNYGQLQLIPATTTEGLLFRIQDQSTPLVIDDSESSNGAFSIVHPNGILWLQQTNKEEFSWTADQEKRAIFFRMAKFATHEGQVGELSEGEVALYQHVQYHGKAWILSENNENLTGDFANLQQFFGLNNTTSSLRLGPNTGVTLFAHEHHKVKGKNRENQIEDFFDNQPDLFDSQLGNDTISSLKIVKQIAPSELFTSVTSKLSQDYRMVGEKLKEFTAYRTILRLSPDVTELEISATDVTTIEVEDVTYEIDEVRSVTLKPNLLHQIMITSEAAGLDTPSLKCRVSTMAENERVIIAPAEELHNQIAELEDNALWGAKDAKGNLIVDQKKHSKTEVANIQNTIKRVMATATASTTPSDTSDQVTLGEQPIAKKARQIVADESNTSPWALHFSTTPTETDIASGSRKANTIQPGKSAVKSRTTQANDRIWEEPINDNEFKRLLSQSTLAKPNAPSIITNALGGQDLAVISSVSSLRSFGSVFKVIGDAVKKSSKIIIGAVNNVLNVIVDVAGQAVRFVLDNVQKVAEFVEAVIKKVVKSIRQFIEFLRFLFDWEDILKTQRFIKNSINTAFDSAQDLVESARAPVSKTIHSLKGTVSDSIDNVIESLGVDPSDVAMKESKLPEAAEWFMNKLFGGIGPGKNPVIEDPQGVLDSSQDPQSQSHLREALTKLVTMAGITMTDGLVSTIEAIVKNPSQPELALATILSLVKELSIQTLDITEDLIMAVLDAIVAAIGLLKGALNTKLRIPMISSLFKLIGAGELSIINVLTILVAIPTTVVSKLLFGERPFAHLDIPVINGSVETFEPLNQRSVARDKAPAESIAASAVAASHQHSQTAIDEAARTKKLVQSFGALSLHASLFSNLFGALLDSIPEVSDAQGNNGTFVIEVLCISLDWMSWLGSFPASPNVPGGFPYAIAQHKVTIDDHPKEFWQRIVWSYRTFVLSLDTIFLIAGLINKATMVKIPARVNTSGLVEFAKVLNLTDKTGQPVVQRIRRGTPGTMGLQLVLAAVDLLLTGIYLFQTPKHDGLTAANEVIAILPNMLGLLRMKEEGAVALGFIQLGKSVANYGMGIHVLANNVKNLS